MKRNDMSITQMKDTRSWRELESGIICIGDMYEIKHPYIDMIEYIQIIGFTKEFINYISKLISVGTFKFPSFVDVDFKVISFTRFDNEMSAKLISIQECPWFNRKGEYHNRITDFGFTYTITECPEEGKIVSEVICPNGKIFLHKEPYGRNSCVLPPMAKLISLDRILYVIMHDYPHHIT